MWDGLITDATTIRSDDDDYDIDFYTAADLGVQENMDPEKPSPREQLEVSQTIYSFSTDFYSPLLSFWLVTHFF